MDVIIIENKICSVRIIYLQRDLFKRHSVPKVHCPKEIYLKCTVKSLERSCLNTIPKLVIEEMLKTQKQIQNFTNLTIVQAVHVLIQ